MNIYLILKGILVGIAKVIPGLSGAVMMISFGLYDKAIKAITNFFSNIKENFLFLVNFGGGVLLGIILFSNIVNYFITNYYVYTTSLFIGLIMSGIPTIKNNIDKINYFLVIISFIFIVLISSCNFNNSYVLHNNFIDFIVFFFSGILEAMGTIVPGVSSTAFLMIIGIYYYYLNILSNLYNLSFVISNIYFILFFGLGLLLGIVVVSLGINYLFNNYKNYSFSSVIGICFASIFLLFFKMIIYVNNIYMFLLCILFIILGFSIGNKL